jgi:cold shock CspA family protein
MKYIGLIKWFDNEKGFGIIGTPDDREIFIHQNNLIVKTEKLLIATSLIFETKKDNREATAINAQPPTSYEDFKLILSYLKMNPSISAEVTVIGASRWGNRYKHKESKSFSIVDYSLDQLLQSKQATEIFEFFKNYFDEHYSKEGSEFALKYLSFTKEILNGIKLELNDYLLEEFESNKSEMKKGGISVIPLLIDFSTNKFLITKLVNYYLDKADMNFLFEVWKNKTYLFNSRSSRLRSDNLLEKTFFKFPPELFLINQSKLSSDDLSRILNQSNGIEIVLKIVNKKISNLDSISNNAINEVLRSIQVLSKTNVVNEIRELFTNKLLELLSKYDFTEIKNETLLTFRYFLNLVKNETNNLNYDIIIKKFNESISDKTKFLLWQETRYFQPDKTLFESHFPELSFYDFLNAPFEFHAEYFSSHLSQIKDFERIENFGLLTLLIIETPYKTIQDILVKLPLKYQAAYWLNFPKGESYLGKYYQADYEITDIPFKPTNFVSYLQSVTTLNELLIASELTNKIQEKYKTKTSNHSNKEGFLNLNEQERKRIIQELLSQIEEFSSAKVVELFKDALGKSINEDCVSIYKSFIPKFIKQDVLSLDELIEIIGNTEIDIKFRQEIFSFISESASKFERVSLWFQGYITKVDFNEVIDVFQKFPLNQQPNVLRKLFSLIQRNKINLIASCLAQLSILAKNQKLNLDVRICLTVINSLYSKETYIGEKILSEIVCQYVNENVINLIQICDLFQECRGRTWMTVGDETKKNWFLIIEGKEFHIDNETVNVSDSDYSFDKEKRIVEIEGEAYSFRWAKKENNLFGKLYDKPIGVTFCDAIKSQKDETLNRNFYWCSNNKCYAPCQTDHIHLEWRKYSLRDFIKILKLPFDEDKYYRFVGVVNRANRLLKKLNCTSCNHLLRDSKTSEFAFYRVTTFHCTNSKCDKLHEVVYLNHCLNWRCLNVVDSRISVTCPNGWYICDSCSNCCSQDKLEKRYANLITNNAFNPNNPRHQKLKYQVDNKLGHLEREEKFNHKSGEVIKE